MPRCHNARVLWSGFSRAASCAIAFNNVSPGALVVFVVARTDTYDTLTDFHCRTRRINFSWRIYTKNLHESARVAKLAELSPERRARSGRRQFSLFLFFLPYTFIIIMCINIICARIVAAEVTGRAGSRPARRVLPPREVPNIVAQSSTSAV